jgi:broad specificity phosphatase PhoE
VLSDRGRIQSAALANSLKAYAPARILSSPLVRCIDTVIPLGVALDVPVEPTNELAEGSGDAAVKLVRGLADHTVVLCSHGDVIPEILMSLVDSDGLDLGSEARTKTALRSETGPRSERAPRVEKASVWVIARSGGRFTRATYVAPPRKS